MNKRREAKETQINKQFQCKIEIVFAQRHKEID